MEINIKYMIILLKKRFFYKYENIYNNNYIDYNDIYNIYLIFQKIVYIYNKCEIYFSLKNKLFKYL